jgi:hypothetical protein
MFTSKVHWANHRDAKLLGSIHWHLAHGRIEWFERRMEHEPGLTHVRFAFDEGIEALRAAGLIVIGNSWLGRLTTSHCVPGG